MGSRVTMQDVADRANVSKSTVSLVFNGSTQISQATLESVYQAANELGYSRDPLARMLRTRRTHSLGLLLPQSLDVILENPYYTQFLQGVGQTCQQEGYTLLLAPPLRGSVLKTIPYSVVDGFIVTGLEEDRGEVEALRQRGIPFVLVDSEVYDGVPAVDVDEAAGMRELVGHLTAQGHRRIAIAAIETDTPGGYENWRGPVRRRLDGVREGLAGAGLGLDSAGISVLEVPCTRAGGAQAFDAVWREPPYPTAIVAFSDIIALGILDRARQAGVDVPRELSVTGFDDLAEAAWTHPSLTTIRQPIATKGRLAAEYLVETIVGTTTRPHVQRLATALLVRESTGPVPG